MPHLFGTYEEAWRHFETVDEMDSFPDQYPERDVHLLTWYIPVPAPDVPAVLDLQRELAALPDLVPIPSERLHVSVAPACVVDEIDPAEERRLLGQASDAWRDVRTFTVALRGVNVFPTAVVVEVRGDGPARLLDRLLDCGYWQGVPWRAPNRQIFLPHVTLATTTGRRPAQDVREVVSEHRDRRFGTVDVGEVWLCRVPMARSRLLQRWEVVGRVGLRA